ncbi:MAG: PKD domain-containing protein [Salibacteraceae bacterium]
MNYYSTNLLKSSAIVAFAILGVLTLSNCKKDDEEEEAKAPTASFTYNVEGQEVTFTFTGSNADIYDWDFGDGSSSSEMNPVHTYAAAGTYNVEVTVENSAGSDSDDENVTIEAEAATAEAPELSFGDADGAFYAINSVSTQEVGGLETTIKLGTAVAWFVDGGTSFVSVGNVSFANSNVSDDLEIQDNNSYVWNESAMSSSGFSNNGVEWSIQGGSGHSAISGLGNLFPFPKTKKVAESSDAISGGSDYTLNHDGPITDADSSIFAVHGPDGSVMRTVNGTTTSVTFSASEMSSVGSGQGILQIASYKITNQELGGKKYYMVNETVASKTVTIE